MNTLRTLALDMRKKEQIARRLEAGHDGRATVLDVKQARIDADMAANALDLALATVPDDVGRDGKKNVDPDGRFFVLGYPPDSAITFMTRSEFKALHKAEHYAGTCHPNNFPFVVRALDTEA